MGGAKEMDNEKDWDELARYLRDLFGAPVVYQDGRKEKVYLPIQENGESDDIPTWDESDDIAMKSNWDWKYK